MIGSTHVAQTRTGRKAEGRRQNLLARSTHAAVAMTGQKAALAGLVGESETASRYQRRRTRERVPGSTYEPT